MFSKTKSSKYNRSLSFRLGIRYAAWMFFSNIVFIVILFLVIEHEFAEKDMAMLKTEFNEIAAALADKDIDHVIKDFIPRSGLDKKGDFLLKIIDPGGKVLYEQIPGGLRNFDPDVIAKSLRVAQNQSGYSTIPPKIIGEETIELYSDVVGDLRIIAGVNTDQSEDFLERFLKIAVLLMFASLLLSFLAGYVSSKRALSPIRQLIAYMQDSHAGSLKPIESLSTAKDELTELTLLFNKMIVQLNQHISALQQSLDGIAHDLRTPLTHLTNSFESLLKTEATTFNKDVVYEFLEETQNMTDLLSTLLELSESESGAYIVRREKFDIKELILECVDLYHYVAEERNAILEIDCKEFFVSADRNKIKRVIANLIDNALKYSSNVPVIQIFTSFEDGSFFIHVKDQGVGISRQDQVYIWQRLYRGDKSRSAAGMGLGLSFVKAIVEAHGWSISVMSKEDAGSTFTVQIPPPHQ